VRAARQGSQSRSARQLCQLVGTEDGQPRRVGSSLAEVAALLGAPGAAVVAALREHWEEVVGQPAALHTRPVRLENGVLSISADQLAK
jgi:predicted nucleic acid-binding Zn ribbon protein